MIAALDDYTPFAAALVLVIGAITGILKITFDALNKKDQAFIAAADAKDTAFIGALDTNQERNEKFLTNHMSTATRQQEHTTEALESVAVGMSKIAIGMDTLHEDSVTAAELLRKQDASTASLLHKQDAATAEILRLANKETATTLEDADDSTTRKVAVA